MGYTHYWTHRRRFTNAEWTEICEDILKIICASKVEIQNEPFSEDMIRINGVGSEGHEDFCILKNRPLEFNQKGWDFCKTNRKPYDVIVTAVLCYLESIYPKNFSVGSDGDDSDWTAGLTLARKGLPEKGNILDIPFEVRFESQWTSEGLYGKNYAIQRHKSGPLCVVKGYDILGQFHPDDEETVVSFIKEKLPQGWVKLGETEKRLDRVIRTLLTYPELVNDPVV